MKKQLLLLTFIIGIIISCDKTEEPPINKSVYSIEFDTIWQNFDKHYVFFDYKNIDWAAENIKYNSQVANVTNYDEFISIISNMLAPLKDVHVWIKKYNGQFMQPYFPAYTVNWNNTIWQQYISRYDWHRINSSWGWFKHDSIGYIAIMQWNNNEILLDAFDAVLDSMRDCKGIILDIRMNGGGYGPLAGSIGGRFVTNKFNCGYIQARNGINHNDFTTIAPIEYPKRGDWQFTKPVFLLMGRGCFSTSEIFAAGMTTLENCITIGDTTGGGLSNSRQFTLSDGTIYSVSDQLIYDTEMNIVESKGIPPQVIVNWSSEDLQNGIDPVFEYAFDLIK